MSIQHNNDRPASLDEIAIATGKSKRTIEHRAKKGQWKYTEVPTKGRHNKRFYALKSLPAPIREDIQASRGHVQAKTITLERIQKILGNFKVVFPLQKIKNINELSLIWLRAIEDLDYSDVETAHNVLIQQLTHFPCPADLREAVQSLHNPPERNESRGFPSSLVQALKAKRIASLESLRGARQESLHDDHALGRHPFHSQADLNREEHHHPAALPADKLIQVPSHLDGTEGDPNKCLD